VEKRFVLFIVLTMLVVVGYNALLVTFRPPPPVVKKDGDQPCKKDKIAGAEPGDEPPIKSDEPKASDVPSDPAQSQVPTAEDPTA
jgi:hypothetical protein